MPCARRRRRRPLSSTNRLVKDAGGLARQDCELHAVETSITVAGAKPAPFRHDACPHGRGPLSRAAVAAQRKFPQSGCVCAALQTHVCQLWVAKRRRCELAFGAVDCPTRQMTTWQQCATPSSPSLRSVGAWRAALASQRGTLVNDGGFGAWRQNLHQLHGVRIRADAGSCVEQILRPIGRVVSGRSAMSNSTVLRLLSCEHRSCNLSYPS